jgi:hypothetical protein
MPFYKVYNIGTGAFFAEQIVVFVSSYALLFLWEMTHTIHRVGVFLPSHLYNSFMFFHSMFSVTLSSISSPSSHYIF